MLQAHGENHAGFLVVRTSRSSHLHQEIKNAKKKDILKNEECVWFMYGFASLYVACAFITSTMNLIQYLYSLWPSFMHFRNLTMETFSKYTLYSRKVKIVFEKSEYSWDVQASMLCLLYMCFQFCLWLDNYLKIPLRDLP